MNLKEQEYVAALARHGNITKAADELCISQPTLSIYIANLERQIGTRLFSRIGKRFVPTYAGERYLYHAKAMLHQNEQFEAELADIVTGCSGRLRVGIHSRRSSFLIPSLLVEFRRLHPNVEVILHETGSKTMEDMLHAGELDIIITNWIINSEGLTVTEIYRDSLLMVTPAMHPAETQAKWLAGQSYKWLDIKAVEYETFILQTPKQATRVFTEEAFVFAGIKPHRVFVIENLETANQLAAEGYGVAFNLQSYAKHFTYCKPVSLFLVGDPSRTVGIYIAHNTAEHLTEYAKDFIKLVGQSI